MDTNGTRIHRVEFSKLLSEELRTSSAPHTSEVSKVGPLGHLECTLIPQPLAAALARLAHLTWCCTVRTELFQGPHAEM